MSDKDVAAQALRADREIPMASSATIAFDSLATSPSRAAASPAVRSRTLPRTALWLVVTAAVAAGLFCIPGRAHLAPVIEADNAYIFLAADRLYTGQGATTIPPRAPLQPWSWRADWVFLTQWPVGYPALLCAVRWLTGMATAAAAVALSVVCCAVALVGWFAWARRCLPGGIAATLLAVVAAGSTFSMDNLVNPASDTVLLAALPLVLLMVTTRSRVSPALPFGSPLNRVEAPSSQMASGSFMVLVGLAAGALVWVRYAAVFVPVAIGAYLMVEWCWLRRVRFCDVAWYAAAAAVPILALVVLNRVGGPGVSAQEQFNLGQGLSWSLPPEVFATAWRKFAQQTPYAHRPEAGAFFACLLPVGGLGIPLLWRRTRVAAWRRMQSPPIVVSAACVVVLLALLVAASVLFQGKYNYVGQARYYQPVRPLYFVLFAGPLLTLPWRAWRAALCVPLALVTLWFVNQDARRTHARMLAADPEVTDYGRQARHFSPGSRELFAWLRSQAGPDLVVFSNFHEEIALETGIPACPTPRDPAELDNWLARIQAARRAEHVRTLFVFNVDNDYRDYYLLPPVQMVTLFELRPSTDAAGAARHLVFEPSRTP